MGSRGLRKLILPSVLVMSSLAVSSQAFAQESKPAIAGVNGKMDIQGGSVGRESAAAIGGTVSIPVAHSFGVQLDTALSKTPSAHSGGVAGHFFTRDPDAYFAGLASMWIRIDGRDLWRNGAETELYLNDYTVSSALGVQNGFSRSTGYGSLELGYYLNDDLFLTGGASGYSDYRAMYVGAEWRPMDDSSLSLFGDVGAGNENGGFATVGLRFSFGAKNSTLKKQHREYDPPNIVTGFTSGPMGGGQVVNEIVNKLEKAPAPAPAPVQAPV